MPLTIRKKSRQSHSSEVDHQRLTSLVNSMTDGVLALDQDAKIVLYNASALNILDVNTIKKGSDLMRLLRLVDKNNQSIDAVELVKKITTPYVSRDLRLNYSDSSLINLYLSIAPVHLGYGKQGQSGYVVVMRDITREKSLEEERDEFISVVSHELRTPIAIAEGSIGNAEFIADKSGDINTIKQALKEAHTQVLFLADMINDLSTLSRAERGKLQVEIEAIKINEFLPELVRSYDSEAKAKNLLLSYEVDPQIPDLLSSKLYVQEILQNFITNALKYTHEGYVKILAEPDPRGVRFVVSDSGIGISKGDQERVFDKFFRSEDFRTRQVNGTGLGLYVTVKLSHLIHAEIDLQSELNKGSTFKVLIPNLK
jgi:signal transduction histidine kinase